MFIAEPLELFACALFCGFVAVGYTGPARRTVGVESQRTAPEANQEHEWADKHDVEYHQNESSLRVADLSCCALPPLPERTKFGFQYLKFNRNGVCV